jgi:Ser/Thr protein kinase RdoA (MazF antagonist)
MKPEQVLHNWDVPELHNIEQLIIKRATSGLLNQTYLIRPRNETNQLFVLQCVHPAVSMDGSMDNYFHVTQFLSEQGLPTQSLLPTREGNLWVEDDGEAGNMTGPEGNHWRWRLLQGVEGEVFEKTTGPAMAMEAGKMLGHIAALLATYPKPLKPGRKSFHYTAEIEKLTQYQERFAADSDEQIRGAATLLHTELPKLLLPKDLPQSIVHADPKVSNFLFNEEGACIGMIDFDTLQVLSPLYEVGDAIRSWCGGDEADPQNTFEKTVYDSFLEGYFSTSKGLLSPEEKALIPQVCKLIMLGLATRFLNDYIDDSYFGWDETKYDSRKAHNKARALGQIALYQSFSKFT